MKQFTFFLIHFLSIFLIYKTNECNKSFPIFKDNQCLLINCTEEQFNEGICVKNNSIIRTQWLNNIIQVGEKDYRYLNFITTSKNETFFETTAYPETNDRIFFGINQDGSPFFEESDENRYIIKKTLSKYIYEAVIGYIKINSDNINYKDKEYIITIGKHTSDTEIFNYNNANEELQIFPSLDFIGGTSETYISSCINIKEGNINYFIVPLIIKKDSDYYYFSLIRYNFRIDSGNSISYDKMVLSENNKYETLDRRIISCFITEKNIIACFYYYKVESKYCIALFSINLIELKNEIIPDDINTNTNFYKCIHLKKEIGIFFYYKKNNENENEEQATIKIIEITENNAQYTFNNYITDFVETSSYINIEKYFSFNDIIKLSDHQICFAGCSDDKEILIIELINFYEENNFNIRYYIIPIFKLYNYKFLWEMQLHKYNQHAIFAFSFCPQKECSEDKKHEHYSSLLIFSYPNINDKSTNLINYFYDNNINYLLVNFTDNVNINNNIFGLV